MLRFGQFKLSDAISKLLQKARGGKIPTHDTTAEQVRVAQENSDASNAGASSRDRMVDIGRGNQQAGRQGQ